MLYGPYGGVRYTNGTIPTSYAFTGQQRDAPSDIMYFHARYYDQQLGQFLSADIVMDGLNRYSYVKGNPETTTDPSGHCPWCVIGAIGGAIIGAGIAYGAQVYNNYQSGAANPWTDNIDVGVVVAGGLAGALIGGTMGAGATAAGAILASGGSAGAAAVAGGNAAAMYAGYGVVPAVGGGATADDLLDEDLGIVGRPPRVNPNAVRYTQAQGSNGGSGYTVSGNVQAMKDGSLNPDDIPAIRVFRKEAYMDEWGPANGPGRLSRFSGDPENLENGKVYSLDNRRLAALQRAGVTSVRVQWMEDEQNGMDIVQETRWHFSTTDYGQTIFIRGLDHLH
jgi:RHS repeat-associated protein